MKNHNQFRSIEFPTLGIRASPFCIKLCGIFHFYLNLYANSAYLDQMQLYRINKKIRTLAFKSAYQKINFLISQPEHMLWVLKSSDLYKIYVTVKSHVSLRLFV